MRRRAFPFRRPPAAGLAGFGLAFLVAMATVTAAQAQFVRYYRVFDEWTVTCALDEPTARTRCELRAPEPSLEPAAGAVRIDVTEPPTGDTAVTLRFNLVVEARHGVSLAVDGNPPYQAGLTRTGEAGWSGAAARAILDGMATGNAVTVRFVRLGDAAFTERRFALKGFPAARQTYLQRSAAAGAARR